ncbi:FAS1 domain-containing protein [Gongronella butleri]|nr:FAS1 domain-containing protein [Gongronella butleri]
MLHSLLFYTWCVASAAAKPETFRSVLQAMNSTKFIDLFDAYGLQDYLDAQDDKNQHTLIVPPNDAMDETLVSKYELKDWLLYHVLDRSYGERDFYDNQLLATEAGKIFLGGNIKQRLRVHVTTQDQLTADKKLALQFGNAHLTGKPEFVESQGAVYPVDQALQLPGDLMHQLPAHLDLSTFVASLFASNTIDLVQHARGITLFAPTNDAFEHLGLVTKFLLHASHKDKLAHVMRFQALDKVYYQDTLATGEQTLPTLSLRHGQADQMYVNKTDDGKIYVRGYGAVDGTDSNVIGKVLGLDMLMRNGVVQKVDRVQLPKTLVFTQKDVLASADCCNGFLDLMEKAGLLPLLDPSSAADKQQAYTVLAPSDRAFAKLNLSHLLQDTELLRRVARLHVIPKPMPRLIDDGKKKKKNAPPSDKQRVTITLDTMHDEQQVVLTRMGDGDYYDTVYVKGLTQNRADIVSTGRVTNGGAVIQIDQVLLPREDFDARLPWWQVLLIVGMVLVFFAIIGAIGYYIWKRWQAYREGYARVEDQPNPDTVDSDQDDEIDQDPQQVSDEEAGRRHHHQRNSDELSQ